VTYATQNFRKSEDPNSNETVPKIIIKSSWVLKPKDESISTYE